MLASLLILVRVLAFAAVAFAVSALWANYDRQKHPLPYDPIAYEDEVLLKAVETEAEVWLRNPQPPPEPSHMHPPFFRKQ